MAAQQIAVVGSMHVCPMVTGVTPHVGGPVSGPGVPGVFVNNQPVSVMGDLCVCTGPPDTIVTGCPGVLVDGKPVVTVGSMTAHGGQITVGVPGVQISSAPMKPAVIPLKNIPFPNISFISQLLVTKQANTARRKQQEVKECVEQKDDKVRRIFNLQWKYKDLVVRESELETTVMLTADTWGFEDGEEVTFSVYLPASENREKKKEIDQVSGKVSNNHIEIEWIIDKDKLEEEVNA